MRGFGQFWYDFIIGDDWKIAMAVVLVLLVGAALVLAGLGGSGLLAPLLAAGIAVAFVVALLIDVRP
ncbi:MAG: hypothetical protein ACRDQB_08090 [Thermocrispum sp.]